MRAELSFRGVAPVLHQALELADGTHQPRLEAVEVCLRNVDVVWPDHQALFQRFMPGTGSTGRKAQACHQDPWEDFVSFVRKAPDARSGSLTVRLAGAFTVTQELG